MLVLAAQKLVVLEAPKTGSLALRAALLAFADPFWSQGSRHTGFVGYQRYHQRGLTIALGEAPRTVAVMREPLRRLQSWFRYRRRDQVDATRISTRDVSFEDFVRGYLEVRQPPFAKVGRQDRFLGWDGTAAQVDHLFDYNRLDLLTDFLSVRIGTPIELPQRNVSPEVDDTDYTLSDQTLTRLLTAAEPEFSLYSALRRKGHLKRKRNHPAAAKGQRVA